MIADEYTHVAFADESNWNQGRFRSIALVTAPVIAARAYHRDLDMLRKRHRKPEFKWSGGRKAQGIALADFFFQRSDAMRVDVLVWDTEDSRHRDVRNRDDKANFARMYYHLLHNVLKRRWPGHARWLVCPDEQKEVDWRAMEEYLDFSRWAREEQLFGRKRDKSADARSYYRISEFRCVCSHTFLLVQLADMFAGLGAYSYTAFDKYCQWQERRNPTPQLPQIEDTANKLPRISRNDLQRFPILLHVREEARKRKFGLSLNSTHGLFTRNPNSPLNFWLYTPQHGRDKAPTRPD